MLVSARHHHLAKHKHCASCLPPQNPPGTHGFLTSHRPCHSTNFELTCVRPRHHYFIYTKHWPGHSNKKKHPIQFRGKSRYLVRVCEWLSRFFVGGPRWHLTVIGVLPCVWACWWVVGGRHWQLFQVPQITDIAMACRQTPHSRWTCRLKSIQSIQLFTGLCIATSRNQLAKSANQTVMKCLVLDCRSRAITSESFFH